jgi:hypothetical protein
MADFKESPFKPMSETYGKIAKSLLSSTGDSYKKDVYKGIGIQAIADGLKGVGANLKQSVIDGANDVKEEYANIFQTNQAEYESFADERARLKRYLENKKGFLNEEAAKAIDNTDEAREARTTWADVDKQPEDIRTEMYKAFNSERKRIQEQMEALAVDPRVKIRTFQKFNERARNEYLAALKLVEDDPTKKGLVRNLWNRVFKTKRTPDGELVTTNSDLLDLQEKLKIAKKERATFRDSIENQVAVEQIYTPLEFKNKDINFDSLYTTAIPALQQLTKDDENYTNVDNIYFKELIDLVAQENPSFNSDQVAQRAYTMTLTKEVDPSQYLTRRGAKLAAGKVLTDQFDGLSLDQHREKFEKDPMLLLQVVEAYASQPDGLGRDRANILLNTFKDVYEEVKQLEPTEQQKLNRIQSIRLRINNESKNASRSVVKANKIMLNDTDFLGKVASNTIFAENWFKQNNKGSAKKYTQTEITDAALDFVMERANKNDFTNIKLTEADFLSQRISLESKNFDESILEDTPNFISQLEKAGRGTEVLGVLRKQYRDFLVLNNNLELAEDEKVELNKRIDNIFKEAGYNPETSTNTNVESYNNIIDNIQKSFSGTRIEETNPDVSNVNFNRVTGQYYLDNPELIINEMDLTNLTQAQLNSLVTMDEKTLANKLGLPEDISLSGKIYRGLLPGPDFVDYFTTPKAQKFLQQRVYDENKRRKEEGTYIKPEVERNILREIRNFEAPRVKGDREIPDSWWGEYQILNPRGIVNTRGLRRGSKYNLPESTNAETVTPVPTETNSLLNSTDSKKKVTNSLTFAESSNNPDALWKQSQRNTFKDFTPTESTLGEVLDFTKFDGEYANWSRKQGTKKTTHTPVGKYQFVGATLRDIKNRGGFDDLNIDNNTIFTENVQDKLFEWYIKDTIKSVGNNATQEEKRNKIRKRFEGATPGKVSDNELDLIIEQILSNNYSNNT